MRLSFSAVFAWGFGVNFPDLICTDLYCFDFGVLATDAFVPSLREVEGT